MAETSPQGDDRKRLTATVRGRVQGVGYRYSACDVARQLSVVGEIRNHWDGTVGVIAEGPEEQLNRFLSWLSVGPRLAHVSKVDVKWQTPQGDLQGFEVRS